MNRRHCVVDDVNVHLRTSTHKSGDDDDQPVQRTTQSRDKSLSDGIGANVVAVFSHVKTHAVSSALVLRCAHPAWMWMLVLYGCNVARFRLNVAHRNDATLAGRKPPLDGCDISP